MRLGRLILCGALLGAVVWSSAAAEILTANADGWHTWQVDEPGASTEMCCFAWKRSDQTRQGCHLDGEQIAFSDSGDCAAAPGTIQVYVRLDQGEPQDIRILSSNCQVSTKSTLTDHGLISIAENIGWFRTIIENEQLGMDVREEALFGLVQSESDAAYDYLDRLLTQL